MSQSAKGTSSQEVSASARRGRPGAAGGDAFRYIALACARAGFADANFVLRWAEIVGPEVARIARPAKLQAGDNGAVLTITCDAGAAVFLQHESRRLIERLNTYLGTDRIARVKLVPGRPNPVREPPLHPCHASAGPHESSSDSSIQGSLPEVLEQFGRLRRKTRPYRPFAHPD